MMLSLKELNKQPLLDERDVIFRMAISCLEEVMTEGDEIGAATGTAFDGSGGISDYKCFYYCHRIPLRKRGSEIAAHGAGYYLYAFSVYVPAKLKPTELVLTISAASDRSAPKNFNISNPDSISEIKTFMRCILDILKSEQHKGYL